MDSIKKKRLIIALCAVLVLAAAVVFIILSNYTTMEATGKFYSMKLRINGTKGFKVTITGDNPEGYYWSADTENPYADCKVLKDKPGLYKVKVTPAGDIVDENGDALILSGLGVLSLVASDGENVRSQALIRMQKNGDQVTPVGALFSSEADVYTQLAENMDYPAYANDDPKRLCIEIPEAYEPWEAMDYDSSIIEVEGPDIEDDICRFYVTGIAPGETTLRIVNDKRGKATVIDLLSKDVVYYDGSGNSVPTGSFELEITASRAEDHQQEGVQEAIDVVLPNISGYRLPEGAVVYEASAADYQEKADDSGNSDISLESGDQVLMVRFSYNDHDYNASFTDQLTLDEVKAGFEGFTAKDHNGASLYESGDMRIAVWTQGKTLVSLIGRNCTEAEFTGVIDAMKIE